MSRWFEVQLPSCDVETIETLAYLTGMTWDEVFMASTLIGISEWSKDPTNRISREKMTALCVDAHTRLGPYAEDSQDTASWPSGYVEMDHLPAEG